MMKRKYLSTTLCILLALVLVFSACSKAAPLPASDESSAPASSEAAPQPEEAPVALDSARAVAVLSLTGKVTVNSNGQDVDAFQGMRLRQGDTITTQAGAVAHLDLDGDKLITLDESSSLSLGAVSGGAQNQKTEITLLAGTASSSISKLAGANSYDVKTANFTMGVRGTIFVVQLDPQTGSPTVSVVEGNVEAKPTAETAQGFSIGAQQSATPTPELWQAYMADNSTPVTQPLNMATLSTAIVSSILVELDRRAENPETPPELKIELQKISADIKAARPEAQTAATALRQQLEKSRVALGLPTPPAAPPATPPIAAAPPVTPPVTPTAPPKTDSSSSRDESSSESGNDNGNDNRPSVPGKPPVKLKTPEVTVQRFDKDGISISFVPVAGATSYAITVSNWGHHQVYSHQLPAPASGTPTVSFEASYAAPLTQTGLYTLCVTAIADKPEKNSNPFSDTKLIQSHTQELSVTDANLTYATVSFTISAYPTGANAYDVLVHSPSTSAVYLESDGNKNTQFVSGLDTLISVAGEYELVITPKFIGDDHDNRTFAPYRSKVTIGQLTDPTYGDFRFSDSGCTSVIITANFGDYPNASENDKLELELYRDGEKLTLTGDWSVQSDTSSAPQSFIITYLHNDTETKFPAGDYTAKIRSIHSLGLSIPSSWVESPPLTPIL